MKFISLIDTKNQHTITIEADSLILRLEIDSNPKETRLKTYMASILYELFNKHPTPLTYEEIIALLKQHHLIISDLTRMHRKLSEIRKFMGHFHPSLNDLILNTRGVGYSLPLRLKNLHQTGENQDKTAFKNQKIHKAVEILCHLINDAIEITAQNKVVKYGQAYVIDRDAVRHIVVEKIAVFNECQTTLLTEIRIHEADFVGLRIAYLLAKLKTYIGLVRICEYPISQMQWLDWFTQEVWLLFEEMKRLIRSTEIL